MKKTKQYSLEVKIYFHYKDWGFHAWIKQGVFVCYLQIGIVSIAVCEQINCVGDIFGDKESIYENDKN